MRFMQQETAIRISYNGFYCKDIVMHTYSRADSLSEGGVSLTICLEIWPTGTLTQLELHCLSLSLLPSSPSLIRCLCPSGTTKNPSHTV